MAEDKSKSEQGNIPEQKPATWRSPSHWFVGVDLGQAQDPTALCVLEAYEEVGDPADPARYCYRVRHLMRFPLGMTYPQIVDQVRLIMVRPPIAGSPTRELIIDETGVGRAVGDIFDRAGLRSLRVTITAGNEESQTGLARWSVPKQVLVSNLDAVMHTQEFGIAENLRETQTLVSELKDFRRHVTEAGRSTYAARIGAHDDLVLAVAIALWRAVRKKKSLARNPAQHKSDPWLPEIKEAPMRRCRKCGQDDGYPNMVAFRAHRRKCGVNVFHQERKGEGTRGR